MNGIVPSRRNLPPEELDFYEALQLVFPKWDATKDLTPKRNWMVGKKPNPDQSNDQEQKLRQVDLIITKTIERRNKNSSLSPKIRKESDLIQRGITCPYYYARLGIAFAAKQAANAKKNHQIYETTRAIEQEELSEIAGNIIKNIENMHYKFPAGKIDELTRSTNRFGHPIKNDIFHRIDSITRMQESYISTVSELNKLQDALLSERKQYVKTNKPDIWMASFIAALGHLWFDLMGDNPTAKGVFSKFADHSYTVLGGIKQNSWFRKIETSINSSPSELLRDEEYTAVGPESLLTCEIGTNEFLTKSDADEIRIALDAARQGNFEKRPDEIIRRLHEHKQLPPAIAHLLRRIPWSVEEAFAKALRVPVSEVEGNVEFHPSNLH